MNATLKIEVYENSDYNVWQILAPEFASDKYIAKVWVSGKIVAHAYGETEAEAVQNVMAELK